MTDLLMRVVCLISWIDLQLEKVIHPMDWRCPHCRNNQKINAHENKLLRTVVTGGNEWMIITCINCKETVSLDKFHAFYQALSKMSPVTNISKPGVG